MIQKGQPALVVAPMEGVTDAAMRAYLGTLGVFSFSVSEFLRISQNVPPPHVFLKHLPELNPHLQKRSALAVQLQLLGGDPEKLAASALAAVKLGAKAIDLNFGCPAPTVNRRDGGATLLKFPERIFKIVDEVRRALPAQVPVSAKLRLGWSDPRDILINAHCAAKGGASWITIHGRTKEQGYRPPADWQMIGEVRRSLDIPVVANGDIWTLEDLLRCREVTGCEHFMLGRSALVGLLHLPNMARELGIKVSASQEPFRWATVFERFIECSESFGATRLQISSRIKQWVRMGQMQKQEPWVSFFEKIKTLSLPQEMILFFKEYDAVENPFKKMAEAELDRPEWQKLHSFLQKEYETQIVYPPREELFRALELLGDEIPKVIILGQDPYVGLGQANGLAFAVREGVKAPPSLKNIFLEIEREYGQKPDSTELLGWARQGVLLLNTVLTVRAGLRNSHQGKGWEPFTDWLIMEVQKAQSPMVFMLWGAPAQKKRALIRPGPGRLVLEAPHPSPLSAYRGFLGSDVFKKANGFLIERGLRPIDWLRAKG